MTDERRRLWLSIAGIAAGSILQLLLLHSLDDSSYFSKYITFADELRAGTIDTDRLPDLSPGYLWFIAALRSAGMDVGAIRSVQVLLLGAVAFFCGAAAWRIASWPAGVAAALFIFLNKAALVNASEFEPEILLLFFGSAGLWLLCGPQSTRRVVLAGAAFGLAAIVRPVALLPAAAVGLWIISRRGLRLRGVPYAVAIALPVLLASGINFLIAGSFLLMDPGLVFYEGMNSNATGYAGVAPRIVKNIEPHLDEGPDSGHVAYRIVAACATGNASREATNHFWTQKARFFMRLYPMEAAKLVLQKVRNLLSNHDAYDVPSMYLKDRELKRLPWMPWPLMFGFAAAGAMAWRRQAVPVIFWALSAAAVTIVFYVSARHRNPLVAGAAILAGLGVAWMVSEIRARQYRAPAVFGATALLVTLVFSLPTDAMKEDIYLWESNLAALRLLESEDPAAAAVAETWTPGRGVATDLRLRQAAALGAIEYSSDPARRFSVAVALLDSGLQEPADQLFESLQQMNYRLNRQSTGVNSLSYYRALASLAGEANVTARAWAKTARDEAPADAHVLALIALIENDRAAAEHLTLLHDPFTADMALANAARNLGRPDLARSYALRASGKCPAWDVPPKFLAAIAE